MKGRWLLVVSGAFAVGVLAWGMAASAQHGHDDDMAMMREMMMNRPKALKQADQTVQTEKKKLMSDGKYGCCLKHPCDLCALKMGACPCGMNAASNKPVCNECKGGWYAGDGAIAGKSANDIKTMPRMDMKMDKHAEHGPRTASLEDPKAPAQCPHCR
ncbi:MAG: hypothetical protein ACP5VE_03750 [Chthonomonadales bacterium]